MFVVWELLKCCYRMNSIDVGTFDSVEFCGNLIRSENVFQISKKCVWKYFCCLACWEIFLFTEIFAKHSSSTTVICILLLHKIIQTSNSLYSRNTFESASLRNSERKKFPYHQKLNITICEHSRNGFTSNHGTPIQKEPMLKIALTSRPNGSLWGNSITLHNSFRESITCDVKLVEMIPHIESQKPKHEKGFHLHPPLYTHNTQRVIDF